MLHYVVAMHRFSHPFGSKIGSRWSHCPWIQVVYYVVAMTGLTVFSQHFISASSSKTVTSHVMKIGHPPTCTSRNFYTFILHKSGFTCRSRYIYTERQKKLITSSEQHSLKSTVHIKINHIWTHISYSTPYQAHLKQQRVACVKTKERKNAVISQKKVIFQK